MRQVDLRLAEWYRLHMELIKLEQLLAAQSTLGNEYHERESVKEREERLRCDTELAFQALLLALEQRSKFVAK
jgi:hypothetical protein